MIALLIITQITASKIHTKTSAALSCETLHWW